MELLNLSIRDERSLTDVSNCLQWAEFGPADIADTDGTELRITFRRNCLEDWNELERAKTAIPGFFRVTFPLVRSQLTLSGLKSLKRRGAEQFDIAQFEYLKKHLLGFKLRAEPLSWTFGFEGEPSGSLKDVQILPERGKRIQMTNIGLTIVGSTLALLVAAAFWVKAL